MAETAGASSEAGERSPINIVLCADGTGNSGGKLRGTNVWRLYNAIARHGQDGDQSGAVAQVAFHDDGVGTEKNKILRTLGGAFGYGFSRNVRELYAALVKTYQPGDRIYLFGFSRGAYTVRALGGLITKCGVLKPDAVGPDQDLEPAIKAAFRAYRAAGRAEAESFKKTYQPHQDVEIQCIGVWDTVDAVGVPFDWLRDLLSKVINWRFHESDLSSLVRNGFHAIAVDDERQTFDPVMWNEASKHEGQVIEQVWFAGVHSNVGGGYPREGMALVSLDWMMSKAANCGLCFVPALREQVRQGANVHAKLYDSRSGAKAFYRYRPRDIEKFSQQHGAAPAKVHRSAFERIAWQTEDYAPAQMPGAVRVVTTRKDRDDANLAEALQAQLDSTAESRMRSFAPLKATVYWRRRLYEALVAASFLFALAALWLREEAPDPAGADQATAGFWLELWRQIIELAISLVPSFLESVIRGLFHNLWLVALAAVVFGVLLAVRRRLETAMARQAVAAWRAAKLPRTLV